MAIKILKSVRGIVLFLKVCGLWPNHHRHYVLYMVYAVIFQFIFTFCYVVCKFTIFFYLTEVHLITKTLFLWLGEAAFVIKVFNFHYHNKELQQLLGSIEAFQIRNELENDLLERRQRMFNRIATCYVGCAGVAVFFSLVSPLFSSERTLPYPSWYPVDWHNNTLNYCLLYAYQVIGIFFMAFAIILLETFAVYLMIMMSMNTDILAMRLKRLGEHATETDDRSIAVERRNYFNLIECFQMHSSNSSLQKSFENVFSIPFFIQFLVSGAILCVTVFQIVMMNPASEIVNFVFYLSYFMTLSTEIFLPCYFGTELLLKNAQLTSAIYSSNWIGRPIYYQKMMAIFMEYTKSPRYLIAGKLFNLSLTNFLVVLNRMYNMYAVLMNFFD